MQMLIKENGMILGIDIGGTKCAVIKAKADGENIKLLDKRKIPARLDIPSCEMIKSLISLADEMSDGETAKKRGIPHMRRAIRKGIFCTYRYTESRKNSYRQYISTLRRPAARGMERVINKEALPQSLKCCKTVPAALGERIGDYAAVSAALL